MKINGPTDTGRLDAVTGKTTAPRPAARPEAGAASVTLSDLASRMQSLETGLSAGDPYDAGRVEELKQAIRDGRFKVNPEVVADRLIESMKELLSRKG